MPVETAGVRLSPLDTSRFGIVVARVDGVSARELGAVLEFCNANAVRLLIARCPVEDIAAIGALTAADFVLMDTLVYYERDLVASPVEESVLDSIEEMRPGDPEQVESIARACFRDYLGHYHADLRLDRKACTEVYASWARSACDSVGPDAFVLVAGESDRRVGFSTFRRSDDGTGELVLGAVLPVARGRGLYRLFTVAGMSRLQSTGATRFITSTHLSNWGAQASWVAAGLRPNHAYHTFHRWFDGP